MSDTAYTSIEGRRLGIGPKGNLGSQKPDGSLLPFTSQAVDATITVGAENTNVRAISIQLKNANGDNVNEITEVDVLALLDANGAAYAATGGSTGLADGGAGTLLAVVAKKLFKARSDATGLIELTWTDTGTEVAYPAVKLASGRTVIGAAMTNT